ncbi:hypothetical protein HID58_014720 [Brassica napus]|uniref:Uncharacterized protein n=1 Tax=Brassica napus TaxID=3708 RepID=A0ABQ8DI30_BRANA|nr:hypothetical protein HID58_014720 [Brassica napus]
MVKPAKGGTTTLAFFSKVLWSLLILVLREKANQSRLPIEMEKIEINQGSQSRWIRLMILRKPATRFFSFPNCYVEEMLCKQIHSMTFLTLRQLANSSLKQCDRQMGHSRANVIVLATSEKLLSVSIFYIVNAVFVLARLR